MLAACCCLIDRDQIHIRAGKDSSESPTGYPANRFRTWAIRGTFQFQLEILLASTFRFKPSILTPTSSFKFSRLLKVSMGQKKCPESQESKDYASDEIRTRARVSTVDVFLDETSIRT